MRLLPFLDAWTFGRPPGPANRHRELAGTLLVDGQVAGTWARRQRAVTLRPRRRQALDRLEEEAHRLAGPLGGPVTVTVALP